jgi:hypothetical protein
MDSTGAVVRARAAGEPAAEPKDFANLDGLVAVVPVAVT